MSKQIVIVAHNIRSTHNVGALLRTADGIGVTKVYLTGYTPYPVQPEDKRLPHLSAKLSTQIHKTALGAEEFVEWEHNEDVEIVLKNLKEQHYTIAGLEQSPKSIALYSYDVPHKIALILGCEVTGIEQGLIDQLDLCLEIPMGGQKESFNVVEAASMAMYHCKFSSMV